MYQCLVSLSSDPWSHPSARFLLSSDIVRFHISVTSYCFWLLLSFAYFRWFSRCILQRTTTDIADCLKVFMTGTKDKVLWVGSKDVPLYLSSHACRSPDRWKQTSWACLRPLYPVGDSQCCVVARENGLCNIYVHLCGLNRKGRGEKVNSWWSWQALKVPRNQPWRNWVVTKQC